MLQPANKADRMCHTVAHNDYKKEEEEFLYVHQIQAVYDVVETPRWSRCAKKERMV